MSGLLYPEDEDYVRDSERFLPYLFSSPPYSLTQCLEMPFPLGIYYLAHYTDQEIVNQLGFQGFTDLLTPNSDRITTHAYPGRLAFLRQYFPPLPWPYKRKNGEINLTALEEYLQEERVSCPKSQRLNPETIVHISANDFLESLGHAILIANFVLADLNRKPVCLTDYLEIDDPDSRKVRYLNSPLKSVRWVADLARDYFLESEWFIRNFDFPSSNKKPFYLLLDDASYSGAQLEENIADITEDDFVLKETTNFNYREDFGVLLPYCGQAALDYLERVRSARPVSLFYYTNEFKEGTNLYFEHKIPDGISIQNDLIMGRISCRPNDYLPVVNECLDLENPTLCLKPPYKDEKRIRTQGRNLRLMKN